MGIKEEFSSYLDELEIYTSKTSAPADKPIQNTMVDYSNPEYFSDDMRGVESKAANIAGSFLWELTDTGLFGVPGLIASRTEWEPPEPESSGARVASAIGGTIGFIGGAPMKIGSKATQMAARGIARMIGKPTAHTLSKSMVQKLVDAGMNRTLAEKIGKSIFGSAKRVGAQARWSEKLANPEIFKRKVMENVDAEFRNHLLPKLGDLTKAEMDIFKQVLYDPKNVFSRPIGDIVDLVSQRLGNKLIMGKPIGAIVGTALNEAGKFAMIDTIMEYTGSKAEDRDYDWAAPIWGAGTGVAFGALHWLPGAGKAAPTFRDFRAGMKAALSGDGGLGRASSSSLINAAKWLGDDVERAVQKGLGVTLKDGLVTFENAALSKSSLFKDGKVIFNLKDAQATWKNVARETNEDVANLMLRQVLAERRRFFGRRLMKWAVSEDFASSLQNWKRMIGGTVIMNAHTIADMTLHGAAPPPPEDILTSVLIGAFLNRRGEPGRYDMNIKGSMKYLRGHLGTLGYESTFNKYGALVDYPTMHDSRTLMYNPLNAPMMRKVKDHMQQYLTNEVDYELKDPMAGGSASPKIKDYEARDADLGIALEFLKWTQGQTGQYVRKESITVAELEKTQEWLMKQQFNGRTGKIKTITDVRNLLAEAKEGSINLTTDHIKQTMYDVIKLIDKKSVVGGSNVLPEINSIWKFGSEVTELVEKGGLTHPTTGKPVTVDDVITLEQKLGKLSELAEVSRLVSRNNEYREFKGNEADLVVDLMKVVEPLERLMDAEFPTGPDQPKFSLTAVDEMIWELANHHEKLAGRAMRAVLTDENPEIGDVRNLLLKAGILTRDAESNLAVINDPEKIKFVHPEEMSVDQKVGYLDARAKAMTEMIVGLMNANPARGVNIDTTSPSRELPYSKIQDVIDYYDKKRLPTGPEDLRRWGRQLVRDTLTESLHATNIDGSDSNVMVTLMNLKHGGVTLGLFSMNDAMTGGYGVRKVEIQGDGAKEIKPLTDAVNKHISRLLKHATLPNKTKAINQIEPLILLGGHNIAQTEATLKSWLSILDASRANGHSQMSSDLEFIVANLDPTGPRNLHTQLKFYLMNFGSDPSGIPQMLKLFEFLNSEGLMIPAGKEQYLQKTIENINKAMNEPKFIEKLSRAMDNAGVRADEIDALLSRSEKFAEEIEKLVNLGQERESKATEGKFFADYLPAYIDVTERKEFELRYKEDGRFKLEAAREIYDDILLEATPEWREVHIAGGQKARDILNDKIQEYIAIKSGTYAMTRLQSIRGGIKETQQVVNESPFTAVLKDVFYEVSGWGDKKISTKNEKNEEILGEEIVRRKAKFYLIDTNHRQYSTNIKEGPGALEVSTDIADVHSPLLAPWQVKKKLQALKAIKDGLDAHRPLVNYVDSYGETIQPGIGLVELGAMKSWFGVAKADYDIVRDTFKREIYDRYVSTGKVTGDHLTVLEKQWGELRDATSWSEVHADAVRKIIYSKMGIGKSQDLWVDKWITASKDDVSNVIKRLSIMNSSSFTKLSRELLGATTGRNREVVQKYLDRGTARVAIFNDEVHGTVEDRMAYVMSKQLGREVTKQEAKDEFLRLTGRNEPLSGYDSITYVSKEFLDMMLAAGGHTQDINGLTVLKPIIASMGEDNYHLFAKTEFVYDPRMDGYMGESTGVDILMSASADKLKSVRTASRVAGMTEQEARMKYPDGRSALEVSPEWFSNAGADGVKKLWLSDRSFEIPLESIGWSKIIHAEQSASISTSLYQYADGRVGRDIFDMHFGPKFTKNMQMFEKVVQSNDVLSAYFRGNERLADIQSTGDMTAGGQQLGNMQRWLQLSPLATPFGIASDTQRMNALMTDFITPILNPQSIAKTSDEITRYGKYGSQSALVQSLHGRSRELKWTDHESKQYGEMLAPSWVADEKISFENERMDLMVDMGNHKIVSWKEYVKRPEIMVNEPWYKNAISPETTVGEAYWIIKDFSNGEHALVASVARYPRTKPIDLTLLRIAGFQGREDMMLDGRLAKKEGRYGNTLVINDVDVAAIFEGDYDIDMAQVFWGLDRSTVKHIQDQWKNRAISGNHPEKVQKELPNMQMNSGDFNINNMAWAEHGSNLTHLKKVIGTVQKTMRLINHANDFGSPESVRFADVNGKPSLRRVGGDEKTEVQKISKWVDKHEKEHFIEIDFNNDAFHQKQTLETQLMIDFNNGTNARMVKNTSEWRESLLFPPKDYSYASEELAGPMNAEYMAGNAEFRRKFLNSKQDELNNPDNLAKRVRLFRKYVETADGFVEQQLTKLEQKVIMEGLINPYGTFLQLSSDVYSSGVGKSPSFENIMEMTNDYKMQVRDPGRTAWTKVRHWAEERSQAEDLRNMFGGEVEIETKKSKLARRKAWDSKRKIEPASEFEKYKRPSKSPFTRGANQAGIEMANGLRGNPHDLAMIKISEANVDKMGLDSNDRYLITGKDLDRFDYALMHLIGDGGMTRFNEYASLLPQVLKEQRVAVEAIKKYIWARNKIKWNEYLSDSQREQKLAIVDEAVEQHLKMMEPMIGEMLPKDITMDDIKQMRLIEIHNDRDARDAIIQQWTMEAAGTQWHNSVTTQRKLIQETKDEMAFILGDQWQLKHSAAHGGASIHTLKNREHLKNLPIDYNEARERAFEILDQKFNGVFGGANPEGLGFLAGMMTPTKDSYVMGVLGGWAFPMPSRPNKYFKHTIDYIFEQMDKNALAARSTFDPTDRAHYRSENLKLKDFITGIAANEGRMRRFFEEGRADLGMEVYNNRANTTEHISSFVNIPTLTKQQEGMFGKLQNARFEKSWGHKGVLGMGPEYSQLMPVLRLMATMPDTQGLVNNFSLLLQIKMENNHLHPIVWQQMINKIKTDLKKANIGGKAWTDKVGVDDIDSIFANLEGLTTGLTGLIAGSVDRHGMGLDPSGQLRRNEMDFYKRIIKASDYLLEIEASKESQAQKQFRAMEINCIK